MKRLVSLALSAVMAVSLITLPVSAESTLSDRETEEAGFTPDIFWNNGEELTWTSKNGKTPYTSPAGVLPTTGAFMSGGDTEGTFVNGGNVAPNPGARFRALRAQALPEPGNEENIVFQLNENAILADSNMTVAAHRRHEAKFLLNNEESTVELFVVNNLKEFEILNTMTGILVQNGGVYIREAVADGDSISAKDVCLAEEGTLLAGEWYTAESSHRIVEDNVVYADVKIYDAAGNVVVNGSMRRVGTDFSQVLTSGNKPKSSSVTADGCAQLQIYGTNVLLDDWKVIIVNDTHDGTVVIDEIAFDDESNATVTLSNTDSESREYLIIVARLNENGKYLETAAASGTLDAGAEGQTLVAPSPSGKNAGETIRVMVWDNWETMSFFGDAVETVVQ